MSTLMKRSGIRLHLIHAARMKLRRRGMSLVEILIALPIGVMLAALTLQVMVASIETFERSYFFSYDPSWLGAERFFAFLDAQLKHCGVGLPETWETSLFCSPSSALDTRPAWADWGSPLSVGITNQGSSFVSAGNDWGNTLRIVAASPSGEVVSKSLSLEDEVRTGASLSGAVKSDSTVAQTSSVSWLLFPGTEVPVRMVSDANSSSPIVEARADTMIPWGTPACRLMALMIYMRNGVLYGNFNDSSGGQPLFRGIEDVAFRLDAGSKVLCVKVSLASNKSGETREVSRVWKVGL